MIVLHLYSHHWRSFLRNGRWRRNWFSRIMYGILVLYFLFFTIFLNQHIEIILKEIGDNPFNTFNSIIILYFSVDLFLRCFLQPLPSIQIIPYLRLKIKRSIIINYLIYRSLWNIFNLVPIFMVIPFIIKIILPQYGITCVMAYVLGFFLIILLNNYVAILFNYLLRINLSFMAIPLVLAASLTSLQKVGVSVNDISVSLGKLLVQGNPALFAVLLMGLGGIYTLIYKILSNNYYIEHINIKSISHSPKQFALLGIFNKYGKIGTYFPLELKLLFRNKRPRRTLIMLPILVVYFSFIGFQNNNTPILLSLFMASCVIVLGAAIYGQFIFSWESSYFDGIMARKNNFTNYIKAKYFLMILMVLVIFTPLFIILTITGKADSFLLLSILLFILGFMCFVIIWLGTYNDGRIDLSQSQFFNYQGVKGSQFILSFIITFIPIGMYLLFKYLFNDTVGKLAIAIPGFLFIITHDLWIKKIIVPRFMTRKYKNLEGYRKLTT